MSFHICNCSLLEPLLLNQLISCINNTWIWVLFQYAESIYVRVYEDRIDLIRAAIVGPAGTPYHDGLFFFDVCFPPEYPQCPPVCYHFIAAFPSCLPLQTGPPKLQSLNRNLFNMHRKFISIRVGFGLIQTCTRVVKFASAC